MAKLVFTVFLVIALIGAGVCEHGDHNYYNCPDSKLATHILCDVTYKEPGKFLNIITKDIKCPEIGVTSLPITCIIVTDLDSDANGGYVEIASAGGVGYYQAVVKLTSQFGKGLNFRVQVYTK